MRSLTWFHANYRKVRKDFGLTAVEAFLYCQQADRLAAAEYDEGIDYCIVPDGDEPVLQLYTWADQYHGDREVLAVLGLGEDFPLEIDERGWVCNNWRDPHIVMLADSLLSELRSASV